MMQLPAGPLSAPQAALSPAEFAAAMAVLGPWEGRTSLAVAVSGGSDSMALALLAADWARDRNAAVLCLIVDHGLRPESSAEAQRARRWLASHGLHAEILNADGTAANSGRGSLQDRARRLRYSLLIR